MLSVGIAFLATFTLKMSVLIIYKLLYKLFAGIYQLYPDQTSNNFLCIFQYFYHFADFQTTDFNNNNINNNA